MTGVLHLDPEHARRLARDLADAARPAPGAPPPRGRAAIAAWLAALGSAQEALARRHAALAREARRLAERSIEAVGALEEQDRYSARALGGRR